MTFRRVGMGALVFVLGVVAGLLGAAAESIVWMAALAVVAWVLVRFLHWRSEWRRVSVATGPGGERVHPA